MDTPFSTNSLRANVVSSLITSVISKQTLCGGVFLTWARIRSTMLPARSVFLIMQPSASRTSSMSGGRRVIACRGDRLVDFMGDRGRKLANGYDAVRVRQLHLHLAGLGFRPLEL